VHGLERFQNFHETELYIIKFSQSKFSVLTGVNSNTKFELVVRPVSYFERPNGVEQRYSHSRNLTGVLCPVTHWQARYHHVRITNCLHL